ncbi:MAG: Fur family transcriptional regulator [Planctomycetota bacterium]
MVEPKVRKELDEIKQHFRKVGLRWTKQREAIVEQAFLTHEHFSAEQLYEMLKGRLGRDSAHLATIYRTLQVLEEGGFIEGFDVHKGEGRLYEHVLGHEHHDHVICNDCGKIFEFHDDQLERIKIADAADLGIEMTHHSLRIFGDCTRLRRDGRCENKVR